MYRGLYDWNINDFLIDNILVINILTIILNFYKYIFLTNFTISTIFYDLIMNNNDLGNISSSILSINLVEIILLQKITHTNTVNTILSQYTNHLELYYHLNLNNNFIYMNSYITVLSSKIYYLINIIFMIIVFFFYFNFIYIENIKIKENNRNVLILLYEEILITWIRFTGIKFESYEEALSIIIIWPWCIFLIFSHIFDKENGEIFFIFIEWGLPIVYGYLIILESLSLFGKFFFIYLNGTRGRQLLIITIIEDIISFIILLSRVTLQLVRGLICGLYHDFFREITIYLFDCWQSYRYQLQWYNLYSANLTSIFIFNCICLIYLMSFVLALIYVLLFLQILFLLIAVWLFCRCWFISTKSTLKKFKLYIKSNKREKNLNKSLKTSLFNDKF